MFIALASMHCPFYDALTILYPEKSPYRGKQYSVHYYLSYKAMNKLHALDIILTSETILAIV